MGRRVLQRKKRDDRGAALVEFAIVAVLLFTLIFGILVFGLLLSKKQTVVQAANEGARSAVPITYHVVDGTTPSYIVTPVTSQVSTSLATTGRSCSDALGTTCTVVVNQCSSGSSTYCVYVTVTLDNKNHPLVPSLLLLSAVNPSTLTGQASAQLTTT
jgi:Flp pilus assembly protein TadG